MPLLVRSSAACGGLKFVFTLHSQYYAHELLANQLEADSLQYALGFVNKFKLCTSAL